jgi:hypothetical protein
LQKVTSYIALLLLLATLCISCTDKKNKVAVNNVSMNPQDIILFFLDSLQNHDLQKVVIINGKSDTLKIEHANWINEMDFLESVNTNKPAYKGALNIDTSRIADTLIYHLKCNDQKLNLKEAFIYYHKEQLMHITMKSFGSNFLFHNAKEIYFNPLKGYRITGFQKLDLMSNQEIAYTIIVNKI